MTSSALVHKMAKAHAYASQPDRIRIARLELTVEGDNGTHAVRYVNDAWRCDCHLFGVTEACAHIDAAELLFARHMPSTAGTSLSERLARHDLEVLAAAS